MRGGLEADAVTMEGAHAIGRQGREGSSITSCYAMLVLPINDKMSSNGSQGNVPEPRRKGRPTQNCHVWPPCIPPSRAKG